MHASLDVLGGKQVYIVALVGFSSCPSKNLGLPFFPPIFNICQYSWYCWQFLLQVCHFFHQFSIFANSDGIGGSYLFRSALFSTNFQSLPIQLGLLGLMVVLFVLVSQLEFGFGDAFSFFLVSFYTRVCCIKGSNNLPMQVREMCHIIFVTLIKYN